MKLALALKYYLWLRIVQHKCRISFLYKSRKIFLCHWKKLFSKNMSKLVWYILNDMLINEFNFGLQNVYLSHVISSLPISKFIRKINWCSILKNGIGHINNEHITNYDGNSVEIFQRCY